MIFPVLDARVTIPGAPIVQSEPAFPYTPQPETGSTHWLFGGDDGSLVPLGGSGVMTPQGDSHTYGDNYVLTLEYGHALVTNFTDADEHTHIACFQYQPVAGKNVLVFGNTGTGVSSGFHVWLSGPGDILVVMPGSTPASANLGKAGLSAGDWIFVAQSLYVEGGVTKYRVRIGSQLFNGAWSVLRPKYLAQSPFLGNATKSSAISSSLYTPAPIKYAEYIVFPSVAKTDAELEAIYQRSKNRMRARGITLR